MQLSIKRQLLALSLIVALLGSLQLGALVVAGNSEKKQFQDLHKLTRISERLNSLSKSTREMFILGQAGLDDDIEATISTVEGYFNDLEFEKKAILEDFAQLRSIFTQLINMIDEASVENRDPDPRTRFFSALPLLRQADQEIYEIIDKKVSHIEELSHLRRSWMLILGCVLLVALVLFSVTIHRSFTRPLIKLRNSLRQVGRGNLDTIISIDAAEEFREIFETFNHEIARLKDVTASRDALNEEVANRKKAQSELSRAVKQLEATNRELQQFAYVASHDLQEPLRMVGSYTQLITKKYGDVLDEDGKRWLNFAGDGALRMKTLIEDLLHFSRLETKDREIESVPLNQALELAKQHLSQVIEETGAQIRNDDLPTIKGDQTRLVSLFQNLIGNSLKYRRENITPEVAITAEKKGPHWTFRVEDNGIGIEPKFSEKVFAIFQRLHARGAYEGTGIGLALCRRIVEQHGGTITLDPNHNGPGTAFEFTLPDNYT